MTEMCMCVCVCVCVCMFVCVVCYGLIGFDYKEEGIANRSWCAPEREEAAQRYTHTYIMIAI